VRRVSDRPLDAAGARSELDPLSLAEIDTLLTRIGVGALDPATVTGEIGRNKNWSGRTCSGRGVFIKQVIGDPIDAARRMRHSLAADALLRGYGEFSAGPRCLGSDEGARLLVFELVDGGRNGAHLAGDGDFHTETASDLGRMLAALHTLDPSALGVPITSRSRCGVADMVTALPLDTFRDASAAELEVWQLLQQDGAVAAKVRDLCRSAERARQAPVHGDLRLDQILVLPDAIHLLDWEEFQGADPAQDVGSFIGEWLYRAVRGITGNAEDSQDVPWSHEEVVARGVAELAKVQPYIDAFWSAYRSERGSLTPDLAVRAAGFAGWHQFDRLLAEARDRNRLSPVDRAVAGVGRAVLLHADQFVQALGLGG
jgi:aminoglycoside phosphotransferase (APT) family kinase protein